MRIFIRGFTLVEMLLSVACLAIIFSMSIPAYRNLQVRNDLDIAASTIAQNMYRAQTLAQVGDGDMMWGVHVSTGGILLYKGVSYVARDQTYDENTSMPTSILITGLADVVFAKVTGIPQATGTVILTSQANEIRNVTINEKGMVDY